MNNNYKSAILTDLHSTLFSAGLLTVTSFYARTVCTVDVPSAGHKIETKNIA